LLGAWIGEACDLASLDSWKQRGFYVEMSQAGFHLPDESITPEFSRAVVDLTHRTIDLTNFVLEQNVGRYRETAGRLRLKTAESRAAIRNVAEALVDDWLDQIGVRRDPKNPEGAA
jgi:hypothetical protein